MLGTLSSAGSSVMRAKAMKTQGIMYMRNMGTSFESLAIENDNTYPDSDLNNPWFNTNHTTASSCYRSDNPIGLVVPDCRKLNYYLYYVPVGFQTNYPKIFIRERAENNQRLVYRHCPYSGMTQQMSQSCQFQQQQGAIDPGPLNEGGLWLQKLPLDTYMYSFRYQTYVPYRWDCDQCKY